MDEFDAAFDAAAHRLALLSLGRWATDHRAILKPHLSKWQTFNANDKRIVDALADYARLLEEKNARELAKESTED